MRTTAPVFPLLPRLAPLLLALFCAGSVHAQWQTRSILVKPGWTAVYLDVDASYGTLDQLVGSDLNNPITQIWLWQPAPAMQIVTSPQSPAPPNSQWANWARLSLGLSSSFNTLIANSAYLVYSSATTNYTWRVLGKPVPPQYTWSTAGLNFLGFPTRPVNPPAFDAFVSLAPSLQGATQIYQYPGGNLGPANPARLFAYHSTPVTRGQAFWVRPATANSYYGPFAVDVLSSAGVSFGTASSQFSIGLRNVTATNVTVTLNLSASETPPAGQPVNIGVPPLLMRGALNTTNLTYAYTNVSVGSPQSWVLAPQGQAGSSITVVLGLNRYAMTNTPGSLYAGILQFTDSLGFTEVDVPVSAQTASTAGLWVGDASVTQVRNYLKVYQTDTNNALVVSSNGAYIVTSVTTNFGAVSWPFPLRLIVHNDGSNTFLLQRVFYGLNTHSNTIVATSETALDPNQLGSARRISAAHLPWTSSNTPWPLAGHLGPGGTLTTTAGLAYDDQAANPFLHTYHPDHDNLDATFTTKLPQGYESYGLNRQITLNVTPPGNDFTSLTTASQALSGNYLETITVSGLGGASRNFDVSGVFTLTQMSAISTLTRP